jgi:DNA end-binding protein Ku
MARALWKGAIAFGLVSIPVGLYVAIEEHRIRFNQLERGTSNRIRYRRVNEVTGEEVPLERIVRALPLGGGRYVVLDDDELAAAAPRRSRTIELLDFVPAQEIDPMLYDTPYYLVPANDAARRPYVLLAKALWSSGRVGVASLVLREREHLAAIRSRGATLVLETMHFADEVRSEPDELEGLEDLELSKRELSVAQTLVESMAAAWEPTRYRDSYRERLEALAQAKARGEQVVVSEPEEAPANVVDLVAALSRSVAAARAKRQGEKRASPTKGRVRPAS